ncbi:hypothetical protein DPMN_173296 [Dreissena polymorpha]|uniref:Uncharacterized protein n=1 Tax=Dreissena polymorpha TaxID=45954 RepID=A0A9D4IE31_DREPO|nr:hypothetical protein DPMN_173296 [Dreissena polymorpha]
MQVTYQCYVCAVLGAMLLPEVNLTPDGALFQISSPTATVIEPRVFTEDPPLCEFSIWEQRKIFFVDRLRQMNSKFIKFGIQFYNGTNVIKHTEPQVLKPKLCFWTYSTAGETYPYLNWNVDFGLLTFGLLDAETI